MNQTSVSLIFQKSYGSPWVHLPPNEPKEPNRSKPEIFGVNESRSSSCFGSTLGGAGLQGAGAGPVCKLPGCWVAKRRWSFIFFYSWGDLVSFSSLVLSFDRLQYSTFFNSSRKVSIEHFLSWAESCAVVWTNKSVWSAQNGGFNISKMTSHSSVNWSSPFGIFLIHTLQTNLIVYHNFPVHIAIKWRETLFLAICQYICIYIHTNTYVYVHIYIYMYTHTNTYVYVHIYIYTWKLIHIHIATKVRNPSHSCWTNSNWGSCEVFPGAGCGGPS